MTTGSTIEKPIMWQSAEVPEIQGKILKLKDELKKLQEDLAKAQSYTLVECTRNNHGEGCGHKTPIGDLTYLTQMYYTEPHGCSGGDYWNEGDGDFICPNCNHRNRLYDRKPVKDLKYYFKGVEKEFPKGR